MSPLAVVAIIAAAAAIVVAPLPFNAAIALVVPLMAATALAFDRGRP